MRKQSIVLISAALVVASILAYTALWPRARQATQQQPARVPSAPLRLAPDIEIAMYQGAAEVGGPTVALSSLWERTGRPVVLNFWAGLCPPCRAEMPDFQRWYDEGGRGRFTLIGVDIGPFIGLGSRDDGRALLRGLGISFPAGTTSNVRTVRNYQIVGMPTTVFITSDGRILRKHAGLLTRSQMTAFSEELLRASGTR